jgi:hypothetical protein
VQFRHDAAGADQHDGAAFRVAAEAEDRLRQPLRHGLDEEAGDGRPRRPARTRDSIIGGGARSAAASAMFSATPPTSVLCARSGDRIFSATG